MGNHPARRAYWVPLLVCAGFSGCLLPGVQPDGAPEAASSPPHAHRVPVAATFRFEPPRLLGHAPNPASLAAAIHPAGPTVIGAADRIWTSLDHGQTFTPARADSCFGLGWQCSGPAGAETDLFGTRAHDLVFDDAGNLHRVGLGLEAPILPYQRSEDRGASWSEAFDLAAPGESARHPWLAANPAAGLVAAWPGFNRAPHGIAVRASLDGGYEWQNRSLASTAPLAGPWTQTKDGRIMGLPILTWGAIAFVQSDDGGFRWRHNLVARVTGSVHTHPVAAFDDAGTLYVVWAEDSVRPPRSGLDVGVSPEMPQVLWTRSFDGAQSFEPVRRVSPLGSSSLLPWVVAGAPGRVLVSWFQADPATPASVPARWHIMAAASDDAHKPDPTFVVVRAAAQPIHVGSVCAGSNPCQVAGDHTLGNGPRLLVRPDGTPLIAWTQSTGAPPLAVAVMTLEASRGYTLADAPPTRGPGTPD